MVKVEFSATQLADPRLPKMLESLGWETDPIAGDRIYAIGVGLDVDHPKLTAMKVIEPFKTIGHAPLRSWTEEIPLRHRVNAAASQLSVSDHAGALELFALANEVGD